MDLKQQSSQPISDDQELAKVLAGVNGEDADNTSDDTQAMSGVVPPVAPGTPPAASLSPDDISTTLPDGTNSQVIPGADADQADDPNALPPLPDVAAPSSLPPVTDMGAASLAGAGELDDIKLAALGELRPLVDKLNLEPAEKFDTYLLLIRSTDDKSLIAPAHEAAKVIPDETKRAQALLDIIKEIDFLSQQQS